MKSYKTALNVFMSLIIVAFCVAFSSIGSLVLWGIGFTVPLSPMAESILILLIYACPVVGFIIGCHFSKSLWASKNGD